MADDLLLHGLVHAFSACLFVLCWAILSGHIRPIAALRLVRAHAGTIACGFGAFAVLILPFLAVYLPKLHETGGEGYYDMLGYLITPTIDMINVGPDNYLWGWLFRPLIALLHHLRPDDPALPARVLRGEHEGGVSAVSLPVADRCGLADYRSPSCWRGADPLRHVASLHPGDDRGLGADAAILGSVAVEPGLLSGAGSQGLADRLALPALADLALSADRRVRLAGALATLLRTRPLWGAAIVILLLAENLSAETAALLSRREQRAALDAIPSPPAGCRSFYVVASRVNEPIYINTELNALYPHNVDAMFLAEQWRVPTINGFSTFNPPDWNFADPLAADYDARVARYVARHGLREVCRLDMRRAQPWARFRM